MYWNGLDDNLEWNQALLCILIYKKKRNKQDDLNNYRGICLQSLVACYTSAIISCSKNMEYSSQVVETHSS
jgi:hypothetical protein